MEGTYIAFRQALERMVLNTTCTCNACKNIPSLDLKFFIHHGTYMTQLLGAQTELVGSDVNLVHRLTKNSITEKTGVKAYAVYTQAAGERTPRASSIWARCRYTYRTCSPCGSGSGTGSGQPYSARMPAESLSWIFLWLQLLCGTTSPSQRTGQSCSAPVARRSRTE